MVVDAAPEMPRGGGGGDEKHSGGKRKKKDDAMDVVSPEDGTDGKTLGERARDSGRVGVREVHQHAVPQPPSRLLGVRSVGCCYFLAFLIFVVFRVFSFFKIF